jgi:hypothetical protein
VVSRSMPRLWECLRQNTSHNAQGRGHSVNNFAEWAMASVPGLVFDA